MDRMRCSRPLVRWLFLLLAMLGSGAGHAQGQVATEAARSKAGVLGLSFLEKAPGGKAFQAACPRSTPDLVELGYAPSGKPEVDGPAIGGYCACMAGYLFARPESPFHGRMQAITARMRPLTTLSPDVSLMLAAIQDAKAAGGESKAAIALGFYLDLQKDCYSRHLDLAARQAAMVRQENADLVRAQALPDRYRQQIDVAVSQNEGGTMLVCNSDDASWPNTRETLFLVNPARSSGDYFDGLLTDAGFTDFTDEILRRDSADLRAALPDLEEIANAIDSETFSAPVTLKLQGDFYRLPLVVDRKEIGHYCLSRAPAGKSYFAGNPPGGKLAEGLDSLLGGGDATACSGERVNNTRSFRDFGGGLMSKCEVVARGDELPARLRKMLEDRAKRFKALPALMRKELERREAKRQSDFRF